jgi:hypothetical protein
MRTLLRGVSMDSEFFRQRAVLACGLAESAYPFTRKRLLDLAERYDARAGGPVPSRASRGIGQSMPLSGRRPASKVGEA